ncbi:MAG: U32 family peptidase [Syntrophomonadaceae bacterium]|nr:U32 family peptidase [Syntrophomonadaceae bacterium]MDD3889679.1 U32 family peptidase [Syntrophomonadaceae bacterium]MDD4550089.1 U32 family peptidase [Syntrophomonadaceae bacterium]
MNPELVLPAGNLEKLQTAVLFGADAVYLGGKEFSLRAFAGNFTLQEISEGLNFAHNRNKKVYITVNILAHNQDLKILPGYLEELARLNVDGLIISDPGIMRLAQKYAPDLPVTISTQANVSNYESAALYSELGARRIVLARELSLDEIAEVKQKITAQIEVFVHGAMCVSYSGRCLLSHYMTGRSANRGECAQPCRYKYAVVEEKRPGDYYPLEEDEKGSYIFNSRDLCLLEYLPRLIDAGVDAFKVEGRMKSPLYVASVAATYRKAIDKYLQAGQEYQEEELKHWLKELSATATRPFTNGFMEGESPFIQDINQEKVSLRADFCGIVKGYRKHEHMLEVEQRANFGPGENLQLFLPEGEILPLEMEVIYDEEMQELDRARHPKQKVLIPFHMSVPEHSIIRRM